jgi:asparagine synthase (glutamine-hydrolysing)
MCGICGVWHYATREPVDREQLQTMMDTMLHRGPDDSGSYFDDDAGLGLGFRRLSIIDLSPAARQPIGSENGIIRGMCNGEIYNFKDLRARLEADGHIFRSHSDTEVIVHAYEQQGERFLQDLDGMFGLAVWDGHHRRLILARDRVGKKPLYYYDDGRCLRFASELKALIADPAVPRTLDWTALAEFLAIGYIAGARSIFAGVRKLQAGCYVLHENGSMVTKRYWDWLPAFSEAPVRRPESEWACHTRTALEDAVRKRMVSDVPLGALLSGGLDSSSIVALMSAVSAGPVKTFSIGFPERRHNELRYAAQIAQRFGTDHHELIVTPERVPDVLPALVRQFDEPFADSSALPTYYVCKMARQHVTVVLSGDGGDEACAGYPRYWKALSASVVDTIPARLRRALLFPIERLPIGTPGRRKALRLMLNPYERYVSLMLLASNEEIRALLSPAAARQIDDDGTASWRQALEQGGRLDALSRMQYADARVFIADDILVKVDRASMLNSLEVRCPFLDHRFLELMASVPPEMRLRNRRGKRILKAAMRGVLPDSTLTRSKMGFAIPIDSWFSGSLASYVREVLLDRQTIERGIIASNTIERLTHTGRSRMSQFVWALLVLELWFRSYLDHS